MTLQLIVFFGLLQYCVAFIRDLGFRPVTTFVTTIFFASKFLILLVNMLFLPDERERRDYYVYPP